LAFDLAIEDPSEWQAIEPGLTHMLASFEVSRADQMRER
jgi:hypothetical protein